MNEDRFVHGGVHGHTAGFVDVAKGEDIGYGARVVPHLERFGKTSEETGLVASENAGLSLEVKVTLAGLEVTD